MGHLIVCRRGMPAMSVQGLLPRHSCPWDCQPVVCVLPKRSWWMCSVRPESVNLAPCSFAEMADLSDVLAIENGHRQPRQGASRSPRCTRLCVARQNIGLHVIIHAVAMTGAVPARSIVTA